MHTLTIAGICIEWEPSITVSNHDTRLYLSALELRALLEALAQCCPQEYAQFAPAKTPARDLSRFSTVCPSGYDTIVGWVAKNRYDIIENLGTTAWLHSRDGFVLTARCRRDGLEVIKVGAPAVLKEQGIEQVNAYPVEVIAERFAD